MDKLGKIHRLRWKEQCVKVSTWTFNFEGNLLKTNEDANQSINQSINQSFLNSAGHKLTPHQTNVRKFSRLWLRSYLFARLRLFTFKLSKFTKGVFTWHWGDFRAGARSLRFPLMALHFFTWYHHKMPCRRETPRREFTLALSQFSGTDWLGAWDRLEFTPFVVLEREFHPETKLRNGIL